jgi:hypothetical protein
MDTNNLSPARASVREQQLRAELIHCQAALTSTATMLDEYPGFRKRAAVLRERSAHVDEVLYGDARHRTAA